MLGNIVDRRSLIFRASPEDFCQLSLLKKLRVCLGFGVQGLVWGLGFRVFGLGFRVQGSGSRVSSTVEAQEGNPIASILKSNV